MFIKYTIVDCIGSPIFVLESILRNCWRCFWQWIITCLHIASVYCIVLERTRNPHLSCCCPTKIGAKQSPNSVFTVYKTSKITQRQLSLVFEDVETRNKISNYIIKTLEIVDGKNIFAKVDLTLNECTHRVCLLWFLLCDVIIDLARNRVSFWI